MSTEDELRSRVQRLYARHRFGIKPGLEVTRSLMERLGHPERHFRCVHVAGTNGKGSVCAMLDAVLRELGLSTGRYTSPHLVRFNERFSLQGEPVDDATLLELIDAVERVAPDVAREVGREPTFFEVGTAIAFELFARRRVDVAVVETGLGGRWDATNVVVPLASVITRIDFDHMAYLGDTLEAIAGEKAGIIKPRIPVVCGAMPEEAARVIRGVAAGVGSALMPSDRVSVTLVKRGLDGQKVKVASEEADYGTLTLPLQGGHQLENLSTAVAALEVLAGALGVVLEPAVLKRGIGKARWPGRCQVLARDPLVILDGAHNPGGAKALTAVLKELCGERPIGWVAGFCADKDVAGFFRELPQGIRRVWAVPVPNERSLSFAAFAAAAAGRRWEVQESRLEEAVPMAREWARAEGGCVVIAGSLFLAGEVLDKAGSLGLGT